MNAARRERVKELLSRAARLEPPRRRAFIEEAAGSDREVAAEALELLETLDDSGFLSAPTVAARGLGASASAREESAGTVIGRYKLLQLIGEGGFGSVFMAEQTEPVVRRVALKLIRAGMDTRQVIARFEAERQALALMDHPNIARVLDAGATGSGRPYFVMELVRGTPITEYCDHEQLSIQERLELFRDVCYAVQHAHQKGVIHRDIKPNNVLVTVADGRPLPKVIDFGIAKATAARLTDKTLFTELHQLIGTPAYMSPEQAESSGIDIDTRSDVYSLGVLLYELLTGTTPLEPQKLRASGLEELLRRIREEEPPRPSLRIQALPIAAPPEPAAGGGSTARDVAARRRSQPPLLIRKLRGDLDWIVMKCLEKARARRYESASALAQDVERYLANATVSARPRGAADALHKFVRRNRGAVLAAGAIFATMIAATAVSIRYALRASAALSRERTEHQRAERAWGEEARQRALAQRAAEEAQQVAEFQAGILAEIDAYGMGRGILRALRDQVRAGMERQYVGVWPEVRPRTPDELAAEVAAFDRCAAAAQATDVARRVMDEFVLRRASDALEEQFATSPLVQAQLLDALGASYASLGMYEQAEPPLRKAMALREAELPAGDARIARSQLRLAGVLQERGDYAAAEALCRAAAASFSALPNEQASVASALSSLADILRERGNFGEATTICEEALALRRALLGEDSEEFAITLNHLAVLLRLQGRYRDAEPAFHRAIDILRRTRGDAHPNVAVGLSNYAALLQELGEYEAAEQRFREGIDLLRQRLGDEHPDVATGRGNLARLLGLQGRYAEAEALHRQALATYEAVHGHEHPDVAAELDSLGGALWQQKQLDAAESLRREALALRRKLLGPDHVAVGSSMNNLAAVLRSAGKNDEAESLYFGALAIFRAHHGNDHAQVAIALTNIGNLLLDRRHYAQAEAQFREAAAICDHTLPQNHLNRAYVRLGLARSLREQGNLIEAERELDAVGDLLDANPAAPAALREKHIQTFIELWDARHVAAPGAGYDTRAAEWRAKLSERRSASQPAPPGAT